MTVNFENYKKFHSKDKKHVIKIFAIFPYKVGDQNVNKNIFTFNLYKKCLSNI